MWFSLRSGERLECQAVNILGTSGSPFILDSGFSWQNGFREIPERGREEWPLFSDRIDISIDGAAMTEDQLGVAGLGMCSREMVPAL